MGATLVYFPASHTRLLSLIKERVVAGRPPAVFPPENVKTGVLSNADKLCACITPSGPGSYTDNFERLFPTIAGTFDAPAIRALFAAADFVGISNYPRLPSPEVAPADFEAGLKTFSRELALFGVDLRDLVVAKGKKVWFSEVGIGGGASKAGWSRTLDPAAAAASTFSGVAAAYRADLDPWHAGGEQGAAMLRLLRAFYRALSVYVTSAGKCPGCSLGWGVDGAFLWNCGSWDVQALYPTSVGRNWRGEALPVSAVDGSGSFADAGVMALVAGHNAAAAAGAAPTAAQAAAAMALPAGAVPALVAIAPIASGEPPVAKKVAPGGPLASAVGAAAATLLPPTLTLPPPTPPTPTLPTPTPPTPTPPTPPPAASIPGAAPVAPARPHPPPPYPPPPPPPPSNPIATLNSALLSTFGRPFGIAGVLSDSISEDDEIIRRGSAGSSGASLATGARGGGPGAAGSAGIAEEGRDDGEERAALAVVQAAAVEGNDGDDAAAVASSSFASVLIKEQELEDEKGSDGVGSFLSPLQQKDRIDLLMQQQQKQKQQKQREQREQQQQQS